MLGLGLSFWKQTPHGGGASPLTAAQRLGSSGNLLMPWRNILPMPDAAIDSDDRVVSSNLYGTISSIPPTRVVGTNGRVPGGLVTVATDATRARTFRVRHYLGGQDVSELRLAFGGYYTGIADGEHDLGNDYVIEAAIEIPSLAAVQRVSFDGGSNTGTVVSGVAVYISDALPASAFSLSTFPANEQIWVRFSVTVANGDNVLLDQSTSANPAIVGEGAITYDSDLGAQQVVATGSLTASGGATSYSARLYPLAILGKTVAPELAVGGAGDSIVQYINDTFGDGQNGAGGWFARGLASVSGRHVPYIRMARQSERAYNYVLATKRIALYPYLTHFISNYGINDLSSLRTPTQIINDLRTIWTAAKTAGIQHVEHMLLIPLTNSTDSWATTVNQTDANANRQTVNSNTVANVGSNGLDAYIDLHTGIIADGVDPTKWAVTGVANAPCNDGIHPSHTYHGLMATAFTTRVATWIVS